jgi:NitT/TauT family transport system permease protein
MSILPEKTQIQQRFESARAEGTESLLAFYRRKRLGKYLIRLISGLLVLGLWHILTVYNVNFGLQFGNLPQPVKVADVLIKKLADPLLYYHIGYSLYRIAAGFLLASLAGVSLGLMVGWYRIAEDILWPTLELLRPIPAIAWMPISILMFPKSEQSIIFIVFISAFFPIFLSAIAGVAGTPAVLVRAAQSLGAKPGAIFREVVIPCALPSICTGLTIGMGVEWFALISAEMISGQFGVGYLTWAAYNLVQYDEIVIGMIFIGLLGYGCSYPVRTGKEKKILKYLALDKREREQT